MNTKIRFFAIYADLLQLVIRDNEAWIEAWCEDDGWHTLDVRKDRLQAIIDDVNLPLTVSEPLGWRRWITTTKI